jgi:hypothetical protein
MLRRQLRNEMMDHCLKLAETSQCFRGDGACEAGIAHLQRCLGQNGFNRNVERPALAQHQFQDSLRSGARCQSG